MDCHFSLLRVQRGNPGVMDRHAALAMTAESDGVVVAPEQPQAFAEAQLHIDAVLGRFVARLEAELLLNK